MTMLNVQDVDEQGYANKDERNHASSIELCFESWRIREVMIG